MTGFILLGKDKRAQEALEAQIDKISKDFHHAYTNDPNPSWGIKKFFTRIAEGFGGLVEADGLS